MLGPSPAGIRVQLDRDWWCCKLRLAGAAYSSAMRTALGVGAIMIIAAGGATGLMVGLMAIPGGVRVTLQDDRLVVEPLRLDKLWCMRFRLAIPLSKVADVRAVPRAEVRVSGIRLPGTYFPGVITAGSYGRGERRIFCDFRRADRLLVIDCVANPVPGYRRLVLEVRDPDRVAATLRQALAAHTA